MDDKITRLSSHTLRNQMVFALLMDSLIFANDLVTPIGISEWMFYFIPLLLVFRKVPRNYLIILVIITTVLILSGVMFPLMGGESYHALLNRLLGVCVLWIATFMLLQYKNSEENLSRTTQLLETILDETHLYFAYMDQDFNFLRVNRSYAESDGKDPSFFPGKNHFDLYPNEDNRKIFNEVVRTGKPYFIHAKPFMYEKNPERGISYWDWSLIPQQNAKGEVVSLLMSLANVTHQVRAEQEVQHSNRLLKSMFSSLDEAVLLVDHQGRLVMDCNDAARKIFGYSGEELIGRDTRRLHVDEKSFQEFGERARSAYELKGHFETEFRMRRKNGEIFPTEHYVSPILEKDGRISAVVSVVRDITERKLSEERLKLTNEYLVEQAKILEDQTKELENERQKLSHALSEIAESREFYRLIGEAIPFGVWMADTKGNAKYFSPSFLELLNMSMQEAEDFGWTGRLLEEDIEPVMQSWRDCVCSGRIWDSEFRIPDNTGIIRTVLTRAIPVKDTEGSISNWVGINLDITERKHSEDQLAYQAFLLENINEAVFALDEKLCIKTWNKASEKIYGWKAEEVLGRCVNDIIRPPINERQKRIMQKRLYSGSYCEFELTHETKSGRSVEVNSITRLLKDKSGKFTGFLAVNRDITERKQAEEALRNNEERFRVAVDNFPFIFVIYDCERRIQFINYYGVKMGGRKFYEYIGRRDEEIYPPEVASEYLPALKRAAETKLVQTAECSVRLHENDYVYIVTYIPLLDHEKNIKEILGVTYDITERKQVEKLTSRKKEQAEIMADISEMLDGASMNYQSIIDLTVGRVAGIIGDVCVLQLISDDGKWIDPVAYFHPDDKKMLSMKKTFFLSRQGVGEGITGRVLIHGKPILIPEIKWGSGMPDFKPEYVELLMSANVSSLLTVPMRAQNKVIGCISLFRISSGRPYNEDDRIFLQNIADKAALAIVNARLYYEKLHEIEERKIVENNLRKTLIELDRSNKELEQFAYIASHDLQEPLRMVASYTQLLAKKYGSSLDATAMDFIGFAVEGAKRMQQLIIDLLAYSRVSVKGMPFEMTDCNLVLNSVLNNLRLVIEETGSAVICDSMPVVKCDRVQIGQVFQNLIENAIKFRSMDDPVVHFRCEKRDHEWIFSVSDNGIGISPDFHDRIFIIFQRLHDRTTYSGNGLGLAICKKIIDRHGGRIWVESEAGQGSTFYFTIPCHAQ
ncbi:MAG: PAS domain S-box protein [Ignavibacteriales bacterium]